MKKILIALTLFVTLTVTAQAQFLNFGFRGGVGMGVHIDDLADNSPILAANIGGFVTFGFTNSQSMLGEYLRLQTGLNLIRRGSKFQEVLDDIMSIRRGTYDAWYVQLPILALLRYELPVREPDRQCTENRNQGKENNFRKLFIKEILKFFFHILFPLLQALRLFFKGIQNLSCRTVFKGICISRVTDGIFFLFWHKQLKYFLKISWAFYPSVFIRVKIHGLNQLRIVDFRY